MPETMVRIDKVRKQFGVSRKQISRYRRAGLFNFDPIAIRREGLWRSRVYPQASEATLEVLEGLKKRGFTLSEMRVLFCTGAVSGLMRGIVSFDEEARLLINPERVEEAKRIMQTIVDSWRKGYKL